MTDWIEACSADEIDEEDLIRWEYEGRAYAIYNTDAGFFTTDLMCTHEEYSLEDGLVIGTVIECPLHQGRFDVRSGKALSAPVCVDLQTWETKVEDGKVFVKVAEK